MAAIGLPRDKITLHYTGLDRSRFRPLGRSLARERLREFSPAIPAQGPLLASVGALIPRKGQGLVIRALPALPDTHLLLVGTGPDRTALATMAQELGVADRVHFLGSLDHALLPVVLSACDAMVLPSASEGLANAWVEALACGTPLVITDAGGARELVTVPDAGMIVERDSGAIATAVRALLANPPAPETVSASAARFSWEANAAALASYYEGLLAR
jgi:glycosyltransferase involved in cell wall biosynthesis